MKNFILIVIITIGFQSVVISQVKVDEISIGTNYIINSKVLEQDRNIQVYIPNGYEANPLKSYPVLYVLDGQEYFLHGIAYQDMLRFRDKSPEFIIVGINTDRQLRRILFYKESDKFITFLNSELIPFIDN
jgi:enterochelin esterase-like enzyme